MLRVLVGLAVLVLVPMPAAGILVMPDGSGDYPTLQAAINAIPDGGSGALDLGQGTFSGPGNRQLQVGSRDIVFRSLSGDPTLCRIDLDGLSLTSGMNEGFYGGFFRIGFPDCGSIWTSSSGMDFVECRFSFIAGGAYAFFGGLSFRFCEFTACMVPPLICGEAGSMTVEDCSFIDNNSSFGDPGVAFVRCLFRGNASPNEPMFQHYYDEGGMPYGGYSFRACRFEDNHAEALFWKLSSPWNAFSHYLTLDGCVFWRNEGTIADLIDVLPDVRNCSFVGNYGAGSVDISLRCEACLSDVQILQNNLHAFREEGVVVSAGPGVTLPTATCCDYWEVIPGDLVPEDCLFEDPLFCDASAGDLKLREGSPCLPENNACGVLIGAEGPGCDDPTSADDPVVAARAQFAAYPNPFNPSVRVTFTLAQPSAARLCVLDISGRRLATLLDERGIPAGTHALNWDGRDESGQPLASGVYLLALEADGGPRRLKITLIR